ncbi:MAG: glycosyltransferase [Bacteroidota bacterium]
MLPSNAEVLDINKLVTTGTREKTRRFAEFIAVYFGEFIRAESKTWFWKERGRYKSVLRHQQALADAFMALLSGYGKVQKFFYAYWIHNSCIMLGLLKRRKAIGSFVCRGHSIDLYDRDWALARYIRPLPFHRFKIDQASAIFPVSRHGEDHLKKKYKWLAGKIKALHLGVRDCGTSCLDHKAVFTLVSCSNFSANKRIEKIMAILAHIPIELRWVHFGGGEGMEKAVHAAKDLPPNIHVEWKGFVPNGKIMEYYAGNSINLFINVSEAEGLPVSMMEAISFGIPVMATAVYGNPEIANETTGFCIPFDFDEKAVAALITQFAGDIRLQEAKRLQARRFYQHHFSSNENYSRFTGELLKYPNP